MIFFCDALSQVVSSDFSAAMNLIGGSQDWKGSVDFVSLRSVVGQSTSEALFVPATPSFPHRYRSLLLLLSVLACSEGSATAGYVAELQLNGRSFFAVQLASQLAPLLNAPQNFGAVEARTSNRFTLLCSTVNVFRAV